MEGLLRRRRSVLTAAIFVVAAVLALGSPAGEAEVNLDRFKSEIDRFVARLEPSTNGIVKWAGSDPYEIRVEGNALVATITNVRLSLRSEAVDQLIFDRVEIRQTMQKEGDKLIELSILLPKEGMLAVSGITLTKIILQEARAQVVVEAELGRGRGTSIEIAGARLEQPQTGAWVSFGPLSMTSKLEAEPDGSWSGPIDFELRGVEFSFLQNSANGVIQRIAFSGSSSGPRLEGLEKLRDALDTPQNGGDGARLSQFSAMLAGMPALFGTAESDATIEGLTVRGAGAEALVSLAKAEIVSAVTGLDSDAAAIRFSVREEGLELSPTLLDEVKVPHRVVVDLGLGNLSTTGLRRLLEAASHVRGDGAADGGRERQQATQQMLGAIAMLDPVFHIHEIAVDTRDVGIALTAEARGSPLAPKGYAAGADLVVRGFDAIPRLGLDIPLAEYLPVLEELGVEAKAPDGTPRVQFHFASAPTSWITINGEDVSAWFTAGEAKPGQPRLLKPSDPPMQGTDVKAVQRALAAAGIAVDQDGVYRPATAAAVAHFQKEQGINVDGVVDIVTRQRLGLAADTPQ